MSARASLRTAGRALALAATAVVLAATSIPHCFGADRGSFRAETTCGPAGVVSLAFEGAELAGCSGGCFGFLSAPGAGAVGLPEEGEVSPAEPAPGALEPPAPGTILAASRLALVGDVRLPGTDVTVRRTCRARPSATPSVLDLACEGDAPGAACAGTLTLVPAVP